MYFFHNIWIHTGNQHLNICNILFASTEMYAIRVSQMRIYVLCTVIYILLLLYNTQITEKHLQRIDSMVNS